MEKINYSLVEYFKNEYELDVSDGWSGILIQEREGQNLGMKCEGTGVFIKLKSELYNIFSRYNLSIFEKDSLSLKKRNKVKYLDVFDFYIFNSDDSLIEEALIERGLNGYVYTILDFKGFSNITPEIFLEDIKNILDKYCILGRNSNDKEGITSVEGVFIKYIDIKTLPHIVKERQMRVQMDMRMQERYNELKDEIKQYKDLKELKPMKELIDKNKSLMKENIELVEKEDIRKKVHQWLDNNSQNINFKIGKELYDIIM